MPLRHIDDPIVMRSAACNIPLLPEIFFWFNLPYFESSGPAKKLLAKTTSEVYNLPSTMNRLLGGRHFGGSQVAGGKAAAKQITDSEYNDGTHR